MAKRSFVWAIRRDNGELDKCTASEETRGKGKCPHIAHQQTGQTLNDFLRENSVDNSVFNPNEKVNDINPDDRDDITQEEIDYYARKIDDICGCRLTEENYEEVLRNLSPKQLDELNKIGFEAAPSFSLPVSDEHYNEERNDNYIYFSQLPDYGIGGKTQAIRAMFGSVGMVATRDGEAEILSNYRDGLTDEEYFTKIFSTRGSQINKTVSVSKPGEVARIAFYALSDIEVIDDCGNDSSDGILHCHAPGICKKCAAKSGFDTKVGKMIGSTVSTHLTEGLTQASLNAPHGGSKQDKQEWQIIVETMKGYGTSPIITEAKEAKTTEDARKIISDRLKEHYKNANIDIDDYNIEILAKQMTSYKRDKNGLRRIKDGELCDFPSTRAIGGHNNIFLQSELSNSYPKLTKPGVYELENNSVINVMR